MESDVDIDVGTGGHGTDELGAGGLRGGRRGDAGLGADGLGVGK